MIATAGVVAPVQLTLELRGVSRPIGRTARRPYWEHVDLADLGGELRAARRGVRVVLGAERRSDGAWTGYHDLALPANGSDGVTKPQPCRYDALVSAAHTLARHCERVLSRHQLTHRDEVRAARAVLRWLEVLDLL